MNEVKNNDEPVVVFQSISQRGVLKVTLDETGQTLAEISGYDLQINFNMELLKSMEVIEATLDGLKQLFRDAIMSQLLENKDKG